MPRIDLTAKPICITGASSGIGRATALACARSGMPVVASARRGDRLNSLVDEIRAQGGKGEAVVADVAEEGSGEAIIERCMEVFGSVYAVFANAGYGYESAHADSTPEQVRAIFETNLFGSLRVIDAAIPPLMQQRSGHILVCSSCLSVLPTPFYWAYSATKAAQHHLASALRYELAPAGVHVSSVHPIGTKSEFFDAARERSASARFLDTPSGSFAQTPERVARGVVAGLRRPRPEIWTHAGARVAFNLSSLTPRLRDVIMRRVDNRRRR